MLKFTLNGYEFILRTLARADSEKYLIFFNGLSDDSIRCRFGHLITKLTEPEAEKRTDINSENEKALAIFDAEYSQILAVGRCYFYTKTKDSEVALVVSEGVRRLGLGRFLLQHLIQIAINRNSRSVHAYVATRNAPVVALLRSVGFAGQSVDENGDLRLTLNFSSELMERKISQ